MKKCVALLIVWVAFATAPAFSADYVKGYDAFDNGDYATALAEFRPLAEEGSYYAQFYLGFMYYNGNGVLQDYKEAAKWYTLSAEQGDGDAQNNLAVMYEKGQGVLQDYKESFRLYSLAVENGNKKAQRNMGTSYQSGRGVLQDYVRAHMWFNLASSNGEEDSPALRDSLTKEMTPAQIKKAQGLARECLAKNYKDC